VAYVFFIVLPSLISFYLSVTNVFEKAVPTQDVGRTKSYFYVGLGYDILYSYKWILNFAKEVETSSFCVKRNRMRMLLGYVVRLRGTASPRHVCFFPEDVDVICYQTFVIHLLQTVSEPRGFRLATCLYNLTASLPYALQVEMSYPILPKC
jgi:hypothetical protein